MTLENYKNGEHIKRASWEETIEWFPKKKSYAVHIVIATIVVTLIGYAVITTQLLDFMIIISV